MKKIIFISALILAAAFNAYAEAPNLLTYQGRLKEGGQAISANRLVKILLCNDEFAGSCENSGEQSVTVTNGLFRSTFTVPELVNFGTGDWWLEIYISGTKLLPRERLTSGAYSLFAATAAYAENIAAATGAEGVYISSNVLVVGYSSATIYYGDGSQLTNLPVSGGAVAKTGDTMTGTLTMNAASALTTGNQAELVVSTNVYTVGYSSAARYYGDGSALTGISATTIADGAVTDAKIVTMSSSKLTGAVSPALIDLSTVTTALAGKLDNSTTLSPLLIDLSTVTTALAGKADSGSVLANNMTVSPLLIDLSTVTTALAGKLDSSLTVSPLLIDLSTVTTALNAKLDKAGGIMNGQLTVAGATFTVTGNAFAVGVSTLVVEYGNVGIGTIPTRVIGGQPVLDVNGHIKVLSGMIYPSDDILRVSGGSGDIAVNNIRDNGATVRISLSGGNVGVGTASPDQKLTVAGNINQTGNLISSGTGANYFAGYVGIGTATPVGPFQVSHEAGSTALTVAYDGALILGAASGLSGVRMHSLSGDIVMQDGNLVMRDTSVGNRWKMQSIAGALQIYQIYDSVGGLQNQVRLNLSDAGSLGIGVTAPDQKLTVAGNISQTGVLISSGVGNSYFAGNIGVGVPVPVEKLDVNGGVKIGFSGASNAGTMRLNGASFEGYNGSAWVALNGSYSLDASATVWAKGANDTTYSIFAASNVGIGYPDSDGVSKLRVRGDTTDASKNAILAEDSAGAGLFIVKNDGRVGIGNNSPAHALHISSGDTSGWNPNLMVESTASGTPQLLLKSGGHQGRIATSGSNGGTYVGADSNDFVAFQSNGMERMRITAEGKVGISNWTAASYMFHISSGAGEAATLMAVSTGATNLFWVAGDGAHATAFYGNGSGLTGVSGDNLGNHTATQFLQMGAFGINTSSGITAAHYRIAGSTVLAILPGTGSLGIGVNAGRISTGDYNVFIGSAAGNSTTGGSATANNFVGYMAGYTNSDGSQNIFIGQKAGYFNSTGGNNTFVGNFAGYENTGTENSYYGDNSGLNNTSGLQNVVLGASSGSGSGSTYSSSTLVGFGAGAGITSGNGNTFLGYKAGDNVVGGGNNIVIGSNQDATAPTISDELNIGGVIWGNLQTGTIGIGKAMTLPRAVLDVRSTDTASNVYAQIWRAGDGTVVASMTSQGTLYATLPPGSGDNLGNHIATQDLAMGSKGIVNVSSISATGVFISSFGSIQTAGPGMSGTVGNARGSGAVDLQAKRGGAAQVASGANSVLSGGINNTASGANSLVAGGSSSIANSDFATVSGGYQNAASNEYAAVSGGGYNVVRGSNSVISGGQYNTAIGTAAVVSGGEWNRAAGLFAVVGGGRNNEALNSAFVGGGESNFAHGGDSVVSGGRNNQAGASGAVGGGLNNNVAGYYSFIGGGTNNRISGQYAIIGGGADNSAVGDYSAVPGGNWNTAKADYSFAAGRTSSSTASGAFTWADSEGVVLENNVADRTRFKNRGGFLVSGSTNTADPGFFVAGSGKVGIGTIGPRSVLDVWSAGSLYLGQTGLAHGSIKADDSLYINIDANNDDTTGLAFLDISGGAGTPMMYMQKSGRVGIGTNTPTDRLQVMGGITASSATFNMVPDSSSPYVLRVGTGASSTMLTVSTTGAVNVSGDLNARIWQRIFAADITTPLTSFSIPNLIGDSDVEYKLIMRLVNAVTGLCTVTLQLNGDAAAGNYNSQWYGASTGGNVTYTISSALPGIKIGDFGSGASSEGAGLVEGTIYAKSGGRKMYLGSSAAIFGTTTQQLAGSWNNTGAIVNTLTLAANLSSCLGAGTHIELWAFR